MTGVAEHNVRPERGGFTLREVAQPALDGPVLGEFIEVVVRVPIDRASSPAAVWGFADDMDHAGIAERLADHYCYGVTGFVNDWARAPGTKMTVRLRAKDNSEGTLMPGWLRDEFINIWEASSGTGSAG